MRKRALGSPNSDEGTYTVVLYIYKYFVDKVVGIVEVWIAHHWAPAWLTCGVCAPTFSPDFILKMETLGETLHAPVHSRIRKVPADPLS